jgi:tRNA threonylcarbamoyladenosine biosynthesis protein TsaB
VVADARRDAWHACACDTTGLITPLRRIPAPELAALPGELWMPAALRAWSQPPRPAKACDYDLPLLLAHHGEADLFHPAAAPDAFQHEAPEYKKWSAQVHSAATAPRR